MTRSVFPPILPPLLLVAGTVLAAFSGSMFLPGQWYVDLAKPAWTPPSGVFGPVWTALYVTMILAVYLVWTKGDPARRSLAYAFYAVQIVLNGLWSFLFFGLHRTDLAMVDLAALLLATAGTVVACGKAHRPAGLVLAPLLAWVGFATVLQAAIWSLNRG